MSARPALPSNRKPKTSRKKDIREAYLNYVKNNNNLVTMPRSKSITNLDNYDPKNTTSSSNYLANEYLLVKNILTATSALEKLRSQSQNKAAPQSALNSSRTTFSVTQTGTKAPEEYYQEILDLKKTIKNMEKNETIYKAKFEYYDSELAKKNQELLDLLDLKTDEMLKNGNSVQSDSIMIISLKKKLFKMEIQMKRKESELKKLQEDLHTTTLKELKISNDILRQELFRFKEFVSNDEKQRFIQEMNEQETKEKNPSEIINGRKAPSGENDSTKKISEANAKLLKELEMLKEELRFLRAKTSTNVEKKQEEKIFKLTQENEFLRKLTDDKDKQIKSFKFDKESQNLSGRDSRLSDRADRTSLASPKPSNRALGSTASLRSITKKQTDETIAKKIEKNSETVSVIKAVLSGHAQRMNFLNDEPNDKNKISLRKSSPSQSLDDRLKPKSALNSEIASVLTNSIISRRVTTPTLDRKSDVLESARSKETLKDRSKMFDVSDNDDYLDDFFNDSRASKSRFTKSPIDKKVSLDKTKEKFKLNLPNDDDSFLSASIFSGRQTPLKNRPQSKSPTSERKNSKDKRLDSDEERALNESRLLKNKGLKSPRKSRNNSTDTVSKTKSDLAKSDKPEKKTITDDDDDVVID